MKLKSKEFLGWKGFWRKNYSKSGNNIEKIFTDKPFSSCKETKLYYDGVYQTSHLNTNKQCIV